MLPLSMSEVSRSLFRVLKNDSAWALSRQFPFPFMLWRTGGTLFPRSFPKGFRAIPRSSAGMKYQALPHLPAGKGYLQF
jgi:hypothetical protein